MFLRAFFFLVCQLSGAALGWWQGGAVGAGLGAVAAGWAWFACDLQRGARLRQWLRNGEPSDAPALRGFWGELADRTRRLLRRQEAQAQASRSQLQDILAALQASPNGVVLLDARDRIEWCNQVAAGHFGLDAERDLMQSIGNLV